MKVIARIATANSKSASTFDLERIRPGDLSEIAPAWKDLEAASEDTHYALSYDWIEAWAHVYRPASLLIARLRDPGGRDLAIGLLEKLPGRRLRFAGGRVTSRAHPLARPGAETAAWSELAGWLVRHPNRWSLLEAAGAPSPSAGLLECEAFHDPEFSMSLPASFEDYLATRPARIRREFARRLRRMEDAGGTVVEVAPAERAAALERFLELHHTRAASKGERHPQVDGRLMRLLMTLDASDALRLRVMGLTIAGRIAGVALTIERAGTIYLFNAGIDPAHMALAPGICLRLHCIRGAIERGRLKCHLGPGDFPYKRDFGGVPTDRWRVIVSSPALAGRLLSGARAVRRRMRATSRAS